MKVLGLDLLTDFSKKHANAKSQLDAWYAEAKDANWKTTHDIKQRYSSADFLSDNRVIFNIKGNDYRLVVKVRYQNGIVKIEWLGTHAEYSKKKFQELAMNLKIIKNAKDHAEALKRLDELFDLDPRWF